MDMILYAIAGGLCIGAAGGAAIGWVVVVPVVLVSVVLGIVADRIDG